MLNDRQMRYCEGVLRGLTHVEAYQQAGYNAATTQRANQGVAALRRNPEVQQYLQARREDLRLRTNVTTERTIQEIGRVAYADIRDVMSWDEDGTVTFTPSSQLNRDQVAAIASVKSKTRSRMDEEGVTTKTTELEVKLHPKIPALRDLAKILGMFQADRMNDADREADLLKTVFGRYVMALHMDRGMPLAEAINEAKRKPEEVEAWGREMKLLPSRDESSSSEAQKTEI